MTATPVATTINLLVLALFVAVFVVGACTESEKCGDDAFFKLYDNGTMIISGNGAIRECNVSDKSKVDKVIISEGITEICNDAFTAYSFVNSVTIPASVISIGIGSFLGCSNLALLSYCGTSASLSCSDTNICPDRRRIAVTTKYESDVFCGCPVTKSDYACSGCPKCKDDECKDIISNTSYKCFECKPGYGKNGSECTECGPGAWSDGDMMCKRCSLFCNGCNASDGNCIRCNRTSELIGGRCNPCREGLLSDGEVCVNVTTWDSVTVNFEPGTGVTEDDIEVIRDLIKDKTGYNVVISTVGETTVRINVDTSDDDVLNRIKSLLEQCVSDA